MSHPFVTKFPDVHCSSAMVIGKSWPEVFTSLQKVKAVSDKKTSALIKMAKFGDQVSGKGSLKHDGNLIELWGIEGDYDGEEVSIEDGQKLLEQHGIRAILYTSWSSTPEKPRWRVLAPLSRPCPKDDHVRLVARLNGALGGILAGESFTLSQGYFVGRNPGQPYTCVSTFGDPDKGECIDVLDSLDAISRGKIDSGLVRGPDMADRIRKPGGTSEWIAELLDGEDLHGNSLRIVGRMVAQGIDAKTIKDTFESWQDEMVDARGETRVAELLGDELDRMISGALAKGYAPKSVDELEVAIANCNECEEAIRMIAAGRLSSSTEETLLRKARDKFNIPLQALRTDLQRLKQAGESNRDQLALAIKVIEAFGAENLLFGQSSFWKWDPKGVWRQVDDREIKAVIHDVIRASNTDVTKNTVDGIVDLIKTELFKDVANLFNRQSGTFINTANCTLVCNKGTWEARPPRREDYITVQIPVAYDPDAKCPRFMQFLDEIFEGDEDKASKKYCVLEAIGYSLTTGTEYEKFMLLIGSGANGKSVLLSVLEELVGPDLVSAVQPNRFDNQFQRAHLAGKLVNIVTEISEGAEIADAQLKAIVSGELTTAEHKLKPPFDFRPYSTCWFGTNHMPHTRDFSDALFRRAIILKFNNKFSDGKCDPHLKEKLRQELPGILNSALEGYESLCVFGGFTPPKESTDAAKEWRLESDQVAQFVADECVLQPNSPVESSALYSSYKYWAEAAGIRRILGRRGFTDRLVRLGGTMCRGTGGRRMIAGFALNPDIYIQ